MRISDANPIIIGTTTIGTTTIGGHHRTLAPLETTIIETIIGTD